MLVLYNSKFKHKKFKWKSANLKETREGEKKNAGEEEKIIRQW